jgi:Ca2+-binding EF-hand superfamily protein
VSNRFVLMAATIAFGATAPVLAAAQAPAAKVPPTRSAVLSTLDSNFKAVDTNGDGTLSQPELAGAEAKTIQSRIATVRSRIEGEFAKLDTNKDGNLSKAEFMAAAPQAPAGSPNGADILAKLDRNKDGKVSADEYRTPMLAQFDRIDSNKDGKLSDTEIKAAARTSSR